MSTPSLEQLCDAFWAQEDRLSLLELEVDGVFVWQAARFAVFRDLAVSLGVFEPVHLAPVTGARDSMAHAARLLRGAVTHNPLVRTPRVDAVVIETPRAVTVDGVRVDVHLQPVVNRLEAEGRTILLLDRDYGGVHDKAPHPRRRWLDALELARAAYRRMPHGRMPDAIVDRLREAQVGLAADLGHEVSILARVFDKWIVFRVDRAFYRAALRRARPRELYCTVSYAHLAPAIAAAREQGVETIEIQHGMLTRYHMGYGYSQVPPKGLAYLPDRIWLWSERWAAMCPLPAQVRREVVGFPHLEASQHRYRDVARVPGRLLVISQGSIGRRLAELVLVHADALADLDIVYKLHPGEYDRGPDYPALRELSRRDNVRVVTELDLHREMAEAEYLLGVYSTAVFEGLEMGCKIVLAELPGIERMRTLLERGDAIRLEDFVASVGAAWP